MSTAAFAMAPTAVRSPLGPALVASVALHAAIAFALIGIVSTSRIEFGGGSTALAVRLTDATGGEREQPSPPILEPATPALVPAPAEPATQAALPVDHPAPAPTPAAPAAAIRSEVASPASSPTPSLATGVLGVRQSQGSATILSDALQQRSQAEYPIEIDKPVRVLVPPAVAYPPLAARARHEGAVVAWTAVGADGEIEDVVVEGDPEFGDTVAQAVRGAKFLPAENDGSPIRFYVILTFEFRAGDADTTPPPATVAP